MSATRNPYAGFTASQLLPLLAAKRKEIDGILVALCRTVSVSIPARTVASVIVSDDDDASCISDVTEFRPLHMHEHQSCASSLPPTLSPLPRSPMTVGSNDEDICDDRTAYTISEVLAMTNDELLANVSRIFGITHMACKHCRSTEVPLHKFVESIRRRCSKPWKGKSGLCPGMELPKSCDNQSERNQRSNGVNNKFFSLIKKAASPEEVEALQIQRSEALYAATEGKIVPKRFAKQAAAGGAGAH